MLLKARLGHVSSFKLSLSNGFGVKRIFGMSMIIPAKLKLGFIDDAVTSGILDCSPFPVIYKSIQKYMLNFNNNDGESTVLVSADEGAHMKEPIKLCITDAFALHTSEVKE